MRLPLVRRFLAVALIAPAALAQVVNPADKQRPPAPDAQQGDVSTTTVTGVRVSEYREEDRIGPYLQPEWTTHRRFPTTRVYVRPPGTFEFEYWKRVDVPRHGGPSKIKTQYEFELGLPGRFQFDMYLVQNQEGNAGDARFDEEKFEVRYAFADWGAIWGNPTLYVELDSRDQEPEVIESKLLLGGELSPGWHWGSNLVFAHATGGDYENEHEITAGVSRTLQDERLSLGGELKAALVNTKDDRGEFEEELLLGPSLQYRPLEAVHLDLAVLGGIGHDSPAMEAFFVLGYQF